MSPVFSIHPELDVKIGDCDHINGKLNADAYHLLLHMMRYAIGRLGANSIRIHVLEESDTDALLCVEHNGQQIKFYRSEMNMHLHYDPAAPSTPKQAYFSASASKFGS